MLRGDFKTQMRNTTQNRCYSTYRDLLNLNIVASIRFDDGINMSVLQHIYIYIERSLKIILGRQSSYLNVEYNVFNWIIDWSVKFTFYKMTDGTYTIAI